MKQYVELVKRVLDTGERREDRTGTGTLSVFSGPELRFNLQERFPLVTVKLTRWRKAFIEMLWFIRGDDNLKYLHAHNVHIWDDWADERGALGPVYGVQWRRWQGKDVICRPDHAPDGVRAEALARGDLVTYRETVDQLKELVHLLKTQPEGRRHIVTAWNPAYIKEMGLPPCHYTFQCYVRQRKFLDLKLSIRSWDLGLGAPFNIAQYALLTHLIARAAGYEAGELIITYGDAHVYLNHVDKLREVVETCQPKDCQTRLIIDTDNVDLDGYTIEDFDVEGYDSHKFVDLPIAV